MKSLSQTLSQLSDRINACHDRATRSAQDAIHAAHECGLALIDAKSKVPHGEWDQWIHANCRVKPRQARKWMQLARGFDAIPKRHSNAVLTIEDALEMIAQASRPATELIREDEVSGEGIHHFQGSTDDGSEAFVSVCGCPDDRGHYWLQFVADGVALSNRRGMRYGSIVRFLAEYGVASVDGYCHEAMPTQPESNPFWAAVPESDWEADLVAA